MAYQVHAEIEYKTQDEDGPLTVHSDICPPDCSNEFSQGYRQHLHDCLDEWLDNSDGSGIFYITGETEKYFPNADRVAELEYELKKLILKFNLDLDIL